MPTFNQSSNNSASNGAQANSLERQAKEAVNGLQSAASDASQGISDKAHEIAETAQQKASEASNAINQKAEDLRGEQKPADAEGGIGAKVKEAASGARDGISSALDSARASLGFGKNSKE